MPILEADLTSTVRSFARAGDINNLSFMDHADRVTHIAFHLGKELGLKEDQFSELILSALLHDIGIVTNDEQLMLADLEPKRGVVSAHCRRGWQLLKPVGLFASLAQNVLEHHDYYSPELRIIPAIIHVADRVDIIVDKQRYYLWQVDDLLSYFSAKRGTVFHPDVIDALERVARIPGFWLDLQHRNYQFTNGHYSFKRTLTISELEEIACLMAIIVDAKSPFTGAHSQGVAAVAEFAADAVGMSPEEVRMMKVAGLLHDIGKLAVPDEILMHPSGLNRKQKAVMQQHPYHSFHLIKDIGPGAEKLAGWAAFHHERLNGTGYPFGLTASELDQKARLMAVVDITQSLLEDRPYRPAMPTDRAAAILRNNVQAGHIDQELTELFIGHLDEIAALLRRYI